MTNFTEYFRGADKVLRGLNALAEPLELLLESPETYGPAVALARQKVAAFATFRAGKLGAYVTLREQRPGVDEFLENARNHLTGPLGNRWSPAWVPLGWDSPAHGLQLPRNDAARCRLLGLFKDYFTAHPERENAAEDYTAARAEVLCGPISDAFTNVDNCKEQGRTKLDERKAALRALDRKTSRVRSELESVLDPMDPRWLKFFDRIPGDPRRPEKVEGLTATAEPGRMLVDWGDTERAAGYDVEKMVEGVDEDFVLVERVDESEAELPLPGVVPGTLMKLRVAARNAEGRGTPSDVLELQAA